MSAMQSDRFEALQATDISEDKALQAAQPFRKRDDVLSLKGEFLVLKRMMGFVLALLVFSPKAMWVQPKSTASSALSPCPISICHPCSRRNGAMSRRT